MSDPQRYAERYLAPLGAKPDKAVDVIDFDARHFVAPTTHTPGLSLSQLFEAGALCGHAEARAELGRRVQIAERELATLEEARRRGGDDGAGMALALLDAERRLTALPPRAHARRRSKRRRRGG